MKRDAGGSSYWMTAVMIDSPVKAGQIAVSSSSAAAAYLYPVSLHVSYALMHPLSFTMDDTP